MNPCAVPTEVKDIDGDNRWMSIHNRFLSEGREKDPDVIFIGDCIFEHLEHTAAWNAYFAPLHCLNFSIYEDRTENVKPKVVVLLVGTNNVQNTADEVAGGIIEIVKTIRDKLADAYIVLPTLLGTSRPTAKHLS